MGWFSSDDKQSENKDVFTSTSISQSTSRTCRDDPDDNNFMICLQTTTKYQNKNGKNSQKTDQKEIRVPKNTAFSYQDPLLSVQFMMKNPFGQNKSMFPFESFFSPFLNHENIFNPNVINPVINPDQKHKSKDKNYPQGSNYYYSQAKNNSKIYDL